MAAVVMAPKRQSQRLNSRRVHRGEQNSQGSGRVFLRQLACVAILILTDSMTIAFALELAISARTHFIPHFSAHVQPSTFPFSHYLVFGWLWMLLFMFLGVEGLYTRRRSIWNEVGHLTKAVGLGMGAFLAAVGVVPHEYGHFTRDHPHHDFESPGAVAHRALLGEARSWRRWPVA